jgi:hemolysin activation/secretion protein
MDKKLIFIQSLLFLIILAFLIPSISFSEQSATADKSDLIDSTQKIYVKSFKIKGNNSIDTEIIKAKLKKMGLKIDLESAEPGKKESFFIPIPLPGITVEPLEEEKIEDKEFEKLKVEKKPEDEIVTPPSPSTEITSEKLEKTGAEGKEFEALKTKQEAAPGEIVADSTLREEPVSSPVKAEEGYYTLEELKRIADAITAIYQLDRYILARAYIPKQEITDNVVTIAVIEGEMGDIEVVGDGYYSKQYTENWFKHLKGRAVKEDEIDRAVLLTTDTPALNVTPTLKKGKKNGTADLMINVSDSLPIKLSFDYDNHGNPLISRDRYAASLQLTDPVIGSTLSLLGITGNSMDDTFYGSIDYNLPINFRGTRIGARYINADYLVGSGDAGILGVAGKSRIAGIYISHQGIRSRINNLKTTLGFDYKHMFEFILDTQRSNDDISAAYLRIDYDGFDKFSGKNYLSLNYSHGFNDFLGSLKEDDPVASRQGADGRFDKFNLDYARVQHVWKDLTLFIKGSGQYSFNTLVYAEQFSIGGATTVRGHSLSKYTGDSGYLVSAELYSPLPFVGDKTIGGWKISQLFQAVIFADHGGVYIIDPIAGEAENNFLSSVGIGARFYLFDRVNLALDVGYPVMNGTIKTEDEIVYIHGTVNVLKF